MKLGRKNDFTFCIEYPAITTHWHVIDYGYWQGKAPLDQMKAMVAELANPSCNVPAAIELQNNS